MFTFMFNNNNIALFVAVDEGCVYGALATAVSGKSRQSVGRGESRPTNPLVFMGCVMCLCGICFSGQGAERREAIGC
jgi:hypothetical protein